MSIVARILGTPSSVLLCLIVRSVEPKREGSSASSERGRLAEVIELGRLTTKERAN